MALRIIEAHVPEARSADVHAALEDLCHESWVQRGGRYGAVVLGVLGAQRTGEALDLLHERFSSGGELIVLVQPLDGMLPRPHASRASDARAKPLSAAAVSREEVYANIADTAHLDRNYLALVVLASVVAAVGMAHDNTAAVIGAMVVAPLLGPNMALALGMVLGDTPLVRGALITNAAGVGLCFVCATLLGFALGADPSTPELASRAQVGGWDIVLALAAGCAGALSYTSGVPAFLTGVMVAVALLPPTVASGVLLAQGEVSGAFAAALLAGANVTALTLAAMLTFLVRGLRPRNWWQEDQARRSARVGAAIYVALLMAIGSLIVVSQRAG